MERTPSAVRCALLGLRTAVLAACAVVLFAMSSVAFVARLHGPTLWLVPREPVRMYNEYLGAARLISPASYGLFGQLTTTRDEIAVEGCFAEPCEQHWVTFRLPFQPNDVDYMAPPVIPHMPRVSWNFEILFFVSLLFLFDYYYYFDLSFFFFFFCSFLCFFYLIIIIILIFLFFFSVSLHYYYFDLSFFFFFFFVFFFFFFFFFCFFAFFIYYYYYYFVSSLFS